MTTARSLRRALTTARSLRTALGLVGACHAGPTAVVTTLVTALGVGAGLGAGRCAVLAAAILCGQLAIGWTNDALDAPADERAGRRDKPIAAGLVRVSQVRAAAVAAGLCAVPLSFALGARAGAVHLAAVFSGLAYDAVLKRTVLSALPYAVSFGLLPSVVGLALPAQPWPPALVTAAGALLGIGAHLADSLPDLDLDAAAGVRGLPHRLGARAAARLAGATLLAATVLLSVVMTPHGHGPFVAAGLVVAAAGATVCAVRRPGRVPFAAAVVVAAVDVVLLVLTGDALR